MALLGTERRLAREQVRAEQGRRHPRGRAAGGVRGRRKRKAAAWDRLGSVSGWKGVRGAGGVGPDWVKA